MEVNQQASEPSRGLLQMKMSLQLKVHDMSLPTPKKSLPLHQESPHLIRARCKPCGGCLASHSAFTQAPWPFPCVRCCRIAKGHHICTILGPVSHYHVPLHHLTQGELLEGKQVVRKPPKDVKVSMQTFAWDIHRTWSAWATHCEVGNIRLLWASWLVWSYLGPKGKTGQWSWRIGLALEPASR